MKKFSVFLILILISTVCLGQAKWPISSRTVQPASQLRRLLQNRFDLIENNVDSLLALNRKGTGNFFYVDSGRGNAESIDGQSWIKAEPTLAAAVSDCTDDAGDFILVAQGHEEDLDGADGTDLDRRGMTVWHIGNGEQQGTYNYNSTDDEIAVSASDILLIGGRYIPTVPSVVHAFDIQATAGNFTMIGAMFPEPVSSPCEFLKGIETAGRVDGLRIIGCEGSSADATGMISWIDLRSAVNKDVWIVDCTFVAECASALIFSDEIDVRVNLINNRLGNLTSSCHAVEFTAATTGFAVGNKCQTDAIATCFDAGAMYVDNTNTWLPPDSSNDYAAVPIFPAVDAPSNLIGFNDNNNAAVTDSVVDNADGSILERQEYAQERTMMCIEKSDGTVNVNGTDDNLFVITGGPIMVEEFVGVVTRIIACSQVDINIIQAVSTPSGDVELTGIVTVDSDATGTTYTPNNDSRATLIPETAGARCGISPISWLCPIGTIQCSTNAGQTYAGTIKWYMMYKPLSPDSRVTVAP